MRFVLQYNHFHQSTRVNLFKKQWIFLVKIDIIEVRNNIYTGSLAEGIISADPGTSLSKK